MEPEDDPCSSGTKEELADCCKVDAPCSLGQGDCDNDSECIGELICGRNNCGAEFPWDSADCCTIQPAKRGRYQVLTCTVGLDLICI